MKSGFGSGYSCAPVEEVSLESPALMPDLATRVICLALVAWIGLVLGAAADEPWEARLVGNFDRGFVAVEEARPLQYYVDRHPWVDRENDRPALFWREPGEFGHGEAGRVEVRRVGRLNGLQLLEIQYRWPLSGSEQWGGARPPIAMLARVLLGGLSDAEMRPFQVIVLSNDEVGDLPASKLVEAGGRTLLAAEIWHAGTGGHRSLSLTDVVAGQPVDLRFQEAWFELWTMLQKDGWQAWKHHRFYPEGVEELLGWDLATLSGSLFLMSPERPNGQLIKYSYVFDGDRLKPGPYRPVERAEVKAREPDL